MDEVENTFDVTVITLTHKEGRIIMPTLNSVKTSIDHARGYGIKIEWLVTLDNPDDLTEQLVMRYKDHFGYDIMKCNFGDAGLTRNEAVMRSHGKFIALIDGDDLITETWLNKGFSHLTHEPNVVYHPHVSVIFEGGGLVWFKMGSDHEDFITANLFEFNYWDSTMITSKHILEKFPYQSAYKDDGYGMEDWHWNCETIFAGINHLVIPKTVVFIRRKQFGSRLQEHDLSRTLIPPSSLFSKPLSKVIEKELQQHSYLESQDLNKPTTDNSNQNFWIPYRIGRSIYRTAKELIRPLIFIHPRVTKWFVTIRIAFLELLWPPSREPIISQKDIANRRIPKWLKSEWKKINNLEPIVRPHSSLLTHIPIYQNPTALLPTTQAYFELLSEMPDDVDDVFGLPWLKIGGSDLTSINTIKALIECATARSIVLFTTEVTKSTEFDRLPKQVHVIDLGNRYKTLSVEQQLNILSKLFIQVRPKRLHVNNSALFFDLVKYYGKAISRYVDMYGSLFCEDYDDEMNVTGFAFQPLRDTIEHFNLILTDNKRIIDVLSLSHGYDSNKCVVCYQPSQIISNPKKPINKTSTLRVLWAGRLDSQKRPETLLEIASEMINDPVEFHVYGTVVLGGGFDPKDFNNNPNIKYFGPFSKGLRNIPNINHYDLYIHTASHEGLPNIILEAAALGIPVLSSKVGGIPEVIKDGETGLLVDDFSDVESYVSAIRDVLNDRTKVYHLAQKAQELLNTQHSWEAYKKHLIPTLQNGNRRIRLLYMIPWAVCGGADRNNINLSNEFKQSGFFTHFITCLPAENIWANRLRANSISFVPLPETTAEGQYDQYVLNYIKSYNINTIFISNSTLGYSTLPKINKEYPQIKVIDRITSTEREQDGGGYATQSSKMTKYIDKTIAISDYLRENLASRFDINPLKTYTIKNGVDLEIYDPTKSYPINFVLDESILNSFVVTYLGRLSEEKNPEKIIEIAKHLINKETFSDIHFILAGDGKMQGGLKEDINRLGLNENVHLIGYVDDPRFLLSKSKILLIVSQMEGQPLSALEAMAMNVPVISTAVGGVPEMITDQETGYLIPFDEDMVESFSDRIIKLYKDEHLRKRLTCAARSDLVDGKQLRQMTRSYTLEIQKLHTKKNV